MNNTMKNEISAYQFKWIIVKSITDKGFTAKTRKLLGINGFTPIGPNMDMYAFPFNPNNACSLDRVNDSIRFLNKALKSYPAEGLLSFTITDKQFGLIGKRIPFIKASVPSSLGWIPVTYRQMYEGGCIPLHGSQARTNHPNTSIYA